MMLPQADINFLPTSIHLAKGLCVFLLPQLLLDIDFLCGYYAVFQSFLATARLCVCGLGPKPSPMATSQHLASPSPRPDPDELPNVGYPGNSDNEEEKEKDEGKEHLTESLLCSGFCAINDDDDGLSG